MKTCSTISSTLRFWKILQSLESDRNHSHGTNSARYDVSSSLRPSWTKRLISPCRTRFAPPARSSVTLAGLRSSVLPSMDAFSDRRSSVKWNGLEIPSSPTNASSSSTSSPRTVSMRIGRLAWENFAMAFLAPV